MSVLLCQLVQYNYQNIIILQFTIIFVENLQVYKAEPGHG